MPAGVAPGAPDGLATCAIGACAAPLAVAGVCVEPAVPVRLCAAAAGLDVPGAAGVLPLASRAATGGATCATGGAALATGGAARRGVTAAETGAALATSGCAAPVPSSETSERPASDSSQAMVVAWGEAGAAVGGLLSAGAAAATSGKSSNSRMSSIACGESEASSSAPAAGETTGTTAGAGAAAFLLLEPDLAAAGAVADFPAGAEPFAAGAA